MFLRNYPTQPEGELVPKPTFGESAAAAFQKPFVQVGGFISDVVPQLSTRDYREDVADQLDVINRTLGDPRMGFGQQAANFVSNMAGSLLPLLPFALAGAEAAGGAVVAGAGYGVASFVPETAAAVLRQPIQKLITSELASYLPKMSISEMATFAVKGFFGYKGAIIPEHVVENYHKETDTINWHDAIVDWSKDNYGFLLPAVPILGVGLINNIFKVNRTVKEARSYTESLLKQHEAVKTSRQSLIEEAKAKAQRAVNLEKQELAAAEKKFKEESAIAETKSKISETKSKLEVELDKAKEEKKITSDQHDFLTHFINNPKDHENLYKKALPILETQQLDYDRVTGRIWFPLMDSKTIDQYKSALLKDITTTLSKDEQFVLSDYVLNNRFDAIVSTIQDQPALRDALENLSIYVDKKMKAKTKTLEKTDELLRQHVFRAEANLFESGEHQYLFKNMNSDRLKALRKYHELKTQPGKFSNPTQELANLLKSHIGLENEYAQITGNILSQESIYNHFVDNKLNLKNAPYEVPKVVKDRLALSKRLKKADFQERLKIGKLKEGLKFDSIPVEVENLTKTILNNLNKTKGKYKETPEYRRLQDLADMRTEAKYALDRINLEAEYNRQAAFAKVIDSFVKMADSNAAKFANPQKVIDHLKRQLTDDFPSIEALEKLEQEAVKPTIEESSEIAKNEPKEVKAQAKKVKSDILKEETKQVKKSKADISKSEYTAEQQRFSQFAENQNVLEEALNCVLGNMNG